MAAPTMDPVSVLKQISINFPNREELSLRNVRALPKDSSNGLEDKTRSSNDFDTLVGVSVNVFVDVDVDVDVAGAGAGAGADVDDEPGNFCVIRARYCMIILVASVFPAPDSPLIIIL